MKSLLILPAVFLASLFPGPQAQSSQTAAPAGLEAFRGELHATGIFEQTGITTIQVHPMGPLTIIEQTSFGEVTGTVSGTFEDELRVLILPNGNFVAVFTLTVDATVNGVAGVLTLKASDVGRPVGPTTGEFRGVAAITNATGGLSGMHGVLDIAGTVDLVSGLSTYSYSGVLHTSE